MGFDCIDLNLPPNLNLDSLCAQAGQRELS